MKRTTLLLAVASLLFGALLLPVSAAGKEVTITGEGKCAKCALHESDKCQTVIQAQENGKTVTYYLTDNSVSKDFHENVCKEPQKVTATGTVEEKDGKQMLTASKIELAK
jgi:hypothetical protein